MNEFANTYEEKHAIWYGVSDGMAFTLDPRHPMSLECILEPHYYRAGFAVGRVVIITIALFLGAMLIP